MHSTFRIIIDWIHFKKKKKAKKYAPQQWKSNRVDCEEKLLAWIKCKVKRREEKEKGRERERERGEDNELTERDHQMRSWLSFEEKKNRKSTLFLIWYFPIGPFNVFHFQLHIRSIKAQFGKRHTYSHYDIKTHSHTRRR